MAEQRRSMQLLLPPSTTSPSAKSHPPLHTASSCSSHIPPCSNHSLLPSHSSSQLVHTPTKHTQDAHTRRPPRRDGRPRRQRPNDVPHAIHLPRLRGRPSARVRPSGPAHTRHPGRHRRIQRAERGKLRRARGRVGDVILWRRPAAGEYNLHHAGQWHTKAH